MNMLRQAKKHHAHVHNRKQLLLVCTTQELRVQQNYYFTLMINFWRDDRNSIFPQHECAGAIHYVLRSYVLLGSSTINEKCIESIDTLYTPNTRLHHHTLQRCVRTSTPHTWISHYLNSNPRTTNIKGVPKLG